MTATTISRTTARPGHAPRQGRATAAERATLLQRWAAGRRHGRYLIEQRRHDTRDLSDRYLDGTDDTHQRQALVAFAQR